MKRVPVPPISLDEIWVQTAEDNSGVWQPNWPDGTTRQVLAWDDEDTGGATSILKLPAGYYRPEEAQYDRSRPSGRFEYHTNHEEMFVLEGSLSFGRWYEVDALGYINHPPNWVHPAGQSTAAGVTLLVRTSRPVDFMYEDTPDAWDGAEYIAAGRQSLTRSRPVTKLVLDTIPWEPVTDLSGEELGIEAKHLWDDLEDGWVTWMMRVPPGWIGVGKDLDDPGGDEILLLEGDVRLRSGGDTIELVGGAYFCDPDRFVYGGSAEMSREGCIAIRWTRNGAFKLPPIRF